MVLPIAEMSVVEKRTITFRPSLMFPRTAILSVAEFPSVALIVVLVKPILATVASMLYIELNFKQQMHPYHRYQLL